MNDHLPKARFEDSEEETLDKARAMIRRGKSDAFVSDYLGMIHSQVASLRGQIGGGDGEGRFDEGPGGPAGSALLGSRAFERNARNGSQRLGKAIDRLLGRGA